MPEKDRQKAKPLPALKKRADFLQARLGEKRRGRYFLLEFLDRKMDTAPRVGITVTKKQGGAVERNRIRRRIREAVRTGGFREMERGGDYVIVGRREILSVPFESLKTELIRRISGANRDLNKG